MTWLRVTVARLLALFRSRRLDRELDEEIAAHLEMAERDAVTAGLSADEARRRARREFGGSVRVREAHRDRRSVRWLENIARDARYGLASLVRTPSFSLVTIGLLTLGIGANAAMFSVLDGVLLKPLPFPESDRIVGVLEAPTPTTRNSITTLNFLDWKRMNTVFESLSVDVPTTANLVVVSEPVRATGLLVSADYFQVFGVEAKLGRTFLPDEDQPGADPVIVISHAAWRSRFGADPHILSRTVLLDGVRHVIVGVLPAGPFDRDMLGREAADFWKPLVFTPEQMTRRAHWLDAVARLRDGVSLEQAREQMLAIGEQLSGVNPAWKRDWRVGVDPFDARLVDDGLRRSIMVAFGAVLLVLLITCANVANLLLARGVSRRREMAMRAALGASHGRLLAQLLTESGVLCVLGSAGGLVVAKLLIDLSRPLLSRTLPFASDVVLDVRVLAFVSIAALAVMLLVGLLPVLQTSGKSTLTLSDVGRASAKGRDGLRRMLVIGEVALSLILICGALLLLRSLLNLQAVDVGARTTNVLTMSADLPLPEYPTPERAVQFYRAAVEAIGSAPGVEIASVASDVPLEGVGGAEALGLPGSDERIVAFFKRVDAAYFDAFDIPVLAGRALSDRDRAGSPPVLVVNQALATEISRVFDEADPIGRIAQITTPDYVRMEGDPVDFEVVGVIANERVHDLDGAPRPVVYVPIEQVPRRDVRFVVRTAEGGPAVMPGIRSALRRVDPHLSLGDVRTMEQVRRMSLSSARTPATVIGTFAIIATLLAALGLYGVLAHAVAQRTREIGIRTALGARSSDVVRDILRHGVGLTVAGLAIGLGGVVAFTRLMGSLLFGVSALDPASIALACLALAGVSLIASLVPARRAARVDPLIALREEG